MMIWVKGEKRAIGHCNTQPPNKWIPNLPKSLWTRYYTHSAFICHGLCNRNFATKWGKQTEEHKEEEEEEEEEEEAFTIY